MKGKSKLKTADNYAETDVNVSRVSDRKKKIFKKTGAGDKNINDTMIVKRSKKQQY